MPSGRPAPIAGAHGASSPNRMVEPLCASRLRACGVVPALGAGRAAWLGHSPRTVLRGAACDSQPGRVIPASARVRGRLGTLRERRSHALCCGVLLLSCCDGALDDHARPGVLFGLRARFAFELL